MNYSCSPLSFQGQNTISIYYFDIFKSTIDSSKICLPWIPLYVSISLTLMLCAKGQWYKRITSKNYKSRQVESKLNDGYPVCPNC